MTRETKIGLLVGLAFIIVIGILLSDHLNSATEPPQAPLARAGDNVRDGVTTPAAPGADGPPVTIVGAPAVAPRQPVPTHSDLTAPARPPISLVQVGRAPAPPQPGSEAGPAAPPAPRSPRPASPTSDLVAQHPDDLVPVPAAPVPSSPTASAPRQYVAQPGDSVSRMAAHLLGANTRANRDLIIRANPSLQADGNPVLVGRAYVIPNAGAPAAPTPAVAARTPAPDSATPREAATGPFQWYTVKDNDSLWRIAEQQLGTGNAWEAIKDLNKDILKGGDTVHPNMRLRLPPKSIARAD